MRLVRYGEAGQERAGVVDSEGRLRSLSPLIPDWSFAHLSASWFAALRAIDVERLPMVHGQPRLGAPLSDFRQILAIGLNYVDHAAEAGVELPLFPMLFQKAISSVAGPNDDILLASGAAALDWEVELAVVIGMRGRYISEAKAANHIAGYCLSLDLSERDWQLKLGGQVGKGKSYDSFTPVGPWILTADEMPDPQRLRIWLRVNEQSCQDAITSSMVFSVAKIIEHVSQYQTLMPGDLVLTGTPAGVGFGMKPKKFLAAGDSVTCGIDLLGEQRHVVVAEELAIRKTLL